MKIFKALFLLCFFIPQILSMEKVACAWYSLVPDTRKKIMACSDVRTRQCLKCVNRELLHITPHDLVHHSPLFLTRREHIECMVKAARENNNFVMRNLLCNANNGDHEDVLDWLPIFDKVFHKKTLRFGELFVVSLSGRIIPAKPDSLWHRIRLGRIGCRTDHQASSLPVTLDILTCTLTLLNY